METDNTVLTNGITKNNTFYPKKNLPSGTLRIILTTECNYKCIYCFAEGEKDKKKRVIKLEDLKKILKISKEFGITNIKLTGGEPLLYPELEGLLKYIREIEIPYIDMTTNISCLNDDNISMLNKYNVNALTLSLNTLKREKFTYLSNFYDYDLVMCNLKKAIQNFKGNIRINCIVFDYKYLKEDYDDIVSFCKTNNLGLRIVEPSYVEGFDITYKKEKFHEYVNNLKKSSDKVLASDCSSVEYLFWGNWYLTIMHSLCDNRLCSTCKEYMYIRITSELKLKPCLSRSDTEVPLIIDESQSIRNAFIEAIQNMGVGKNEDK